jgi:hypothetical protein
MHVARAGPGGTGLFVAQANVDLPGPLRNHLPRVAAIPIARPSQRFGPIDVDDIALRQILNEFVR